MKWFLFVLCVAFWVIGEPAYAQYYFPTPGGPVPYAMNPGYAAQPGYGGPSPYIQGQLPPWDQRAPFALFYANPVCHYAPGEWGWRQECF